MSSYPFEVHLICIFSWAFTASDWHLVEWYPLVYGNISISNVFTGDWTAVAIQNVESGMRLSIVHQWQWYRLGVIPNHTLSLCLHNSCCCIILIFFHVTIVDYLHNTVRWNASLRQLPVYWWWQQLALIYHAQHIRLWKCRCWREGMVCGQVWLQLLLLLSCGFQKVSTFLEATCHSQLCRGQTPMVPDTKTKRETRSLQQSAKSAGYIKISLSLSLRHVQRSFSAAIPTLFSNLQLNKRKES